MYTQMNPTKLSSMSAYKQQVHPPEKNLPKNMLNWEELHWLLNEKRIEECQDSLDEYFIIEDISIQEMTTSL